MITAESKTEEFQTTFTNGTYTGTTDAPKDHGGAGANFAPGELLESALACCINTIVRIAAKNHDIPLEGVTVTVTMKTDSPVETVFEYKIDLKGELTGAQRDSLLRAAGACPVHKALAKTAIFRPVK